MQMLTRIILYIYYGIIVHKYTVLKSDIIAFLVNGAKRSLVPLAHPQIVTIAHPFLEFPVKQR